MLLNTHVWPQMMCELADRKSLRISAQDTDFKVKVFLIAVSGCKLSCSCKVLFYINKHVTLSHLRSKESTGIHEPCIPILLPARAGKSLVPMLQLLHIALFTYSICMYCFHLNLYNGLFSKEFYF